MKRTMKKGIETSDYTPNRHKYVHTRMHIYKHTLYTHIYSTHTHRHIHMNTHTHTFKHTHTHIIHTFI